MIATTMSAAVARVAGCSSTDVADGDPATPAVGTDDRCQLDHPVGPGSTRTAAINADLGYHGSLLRVSVDDD
jgi:hypothetical protein